MGKCVELTRDERARQHLRKLNKIYKRLPPDRKTVAETLGQRLAFLRVTLEDLENDINEYGMTEDFSQTPNVIYKRERPAVGIYNRTVKNYGVLLKQLLDLLPGEKGKEVDDNDLMDFVKKARR